MILVTENPQIQGFPVEKVKTTTWGYHGNIMNHDNIHIIIYIYIHQKKSYFTVKKDNFHEFPIEPFPEKTCVM